MQGLFDQALALYQRGDLGAAARKFERVLARQPRHADSLHLLGCIRLERGRTDEALRLLRQAVTVTPGVAMFHEDLAQAHLRRGELELAETECVLAQRCDAGRAQPHNLLGLIALERCQYQAAIDGFNAALGVQKLHLDAIINLAVALNRTGEYAMAEKYCELVLRLSPENPLALTNLGLAYRGMRRLDEARQALERAGEFPRARFNLGYLHLLEGDLERGLPLCEARKALLRIGEGLARPEWDGRTRAGKTLLVIHEQGLGDTIMMCRFYPRLFEHFAHVVALVQPSLARLVATVDPRVRVVTELGNTRYDNWCATMSLPLKLGVRSLDQVPLGPWLDVPAPERRDGRLRAGLNWAGNPKFAFDYVRSTHLENLKLLLEVRDIEWCSLHRGHLEHEAEAFGLPQPLREAADFHDTAAVLRGLDLVISTETAVPNLSAALGVRTCVLASPDADWRWKSWYANVSLCAQDEPGNWPSAVAKALEVVRGELARGGRKVEAGDCAAA
jgi:Flp pilus assembly protein TadD